MLRRGELLVDRGRRGVEDGEFEEREAVCRFEEVVDLVLLEGPAWGRLGWLDGLDWVEAGGDGVGWVCAFPAFGLEFLDRVWGFLGVGWAVLGSSESVLGFFALVGEKMDGSREEEGR